MDFLYGQSYLLAALRETLKELTDEKFLARNVADTIYGIGCKTVSNFLIKDPPVGPQQHQLANVDILSGHLRVYRFRKDIWTLYIDDCVLQLGMPYRSFDRPGSCAASQAGYSPLMQPWTQFSDNSGQQQQPYEFPSAPFSQQQDTQQGSDNLRRVFPRNSSRTSSCMRLQVPATLKVIAADTRLWTTSTKTSSGHGNS